MAQGWRDGGRKRKMRKGDEKRNEAVLCTRSNCAQGMTALHPAKMH